MISLEVYIKHLKKTPSLCWQKPLNTY